MHKQWELTMHNNYSFMNISIRAPAVDSALNLLLVEKNCSQHGALATFVHAGHCRASHSSRYVFHLLRNVPSSPSSSSLQVTASANRALFFLGLIYKNSKQLSTMTYLPASNAILTRIPCWLLARAPAQHQSQTQPLV